MQTDIRLFDFKMHTEDRALVHVFVDQLLDEAYLTNHTLVEKFESEFSHWSKVRFNVAVNNGSSALVSAFLSLPKDPKKTKVLLPTNTFIACWYAALQAGYEPVLIDSDRNFLGFDLEKVEEHLKFGNVAAVLAVHIGGIIDPSFEKLQKWRTQYEFILIEDAAHAHGSHLNHAPAGSLGDMATFSFHLTKVITGGEGGVVSTANEELYESLLSVRQFGKSKTNPHVFDRMGGNYKMAEMQAALILADLNRAEKRIARRREIAALYFEGLKNTELKFLKPSQNSESSYYKCIGILPRNNREKLFNELQKNRIQMPNGVYYTNLHKQPVVKAQNKHFPNADVFADQHICLPCYPELTNEQVDYFINVFKRCSDAGLV